ncbi:MAG: restriction endonuclease subunit S [Patescibacteria group bacterium]
MAKNSQNLTKKIPKLRFPGFSGVWEEKKLGNICEYKNGGSYEDSVVENGKYNLITLNSIDIDGKLKSNHKKVNDSDWFLQKGDLVMVLSDVAHGNFLGLVDVIPEDNKYILNQRMGLLRKKDDSVDLKYLRRYINKKQRYFKLHGQGSSQQNLSKGDILKFNIILPKLEEQKKIAGFLGSVDEWIENLRSQKESLKSYKKGMMQKIFSQKIRFKDDKGKDFSEWEEKKLGDLGKTYNGLIGKTINDFGNGEPFITYKQIFNNSEIDVNNFGFVKISQEEKQNKASFGDVFFTTSSETPNEVGFASVLLNNEVAPYLNSFSFGYRLNEKFDPYFAKFLFRNHVYRREVVKLAQGSTRYNISKLEFLKIKLKIPPLLEQQKIAELLASLDNLIGSKQQQITQVEQWKNGLMQELFV